MAELTLYRLEMKAPSFNGSPMAEQSIRHLASAVLPKEHARKLMEAVKQAKTLNKVQIIRDLREMFVGAKKALNSDGSPHQPCGWFTWLDDMKQFSQMFPGVVFILTCMGQSVDDIWKAYVVNGRVQVVVAEVIFEAYDPALLEDIS